MAHSALTFWYVVFLPMYMTHTSHRCKVCQETYGGQLAFENHLASVHNITGQREIESKYIPDFGKPCSLTRQHQCYICRKLIRHDYKTIFTHLTKHKMDIEAYAVEFRPFLETELKEKRMGYVVEKALESASALTVEEYLSKRTGTDLQDQTDPMDGWSDCSEHKCAICDHTAWSNLRFHWHVKRQHGIASTKEYRRLHGDPEKMLRQHRCQICHNLIKWEASRIRDHLKFHREPENKLTLKEYGERFREHITAEVTKFKYPEASKQEVVESECLGDEEVVGEGYNVGEWKALFSKKVTPQDKVECNICRKTLNRHSFTRHQEKAHKGILNVRDLNRLKKKQAQLAKTGVIKSLGELMASAGGVVVMKGKGEEKEKVDIQQEDMESRLNLYKAGLTLDQIESKVNLLHSGLTITRAVKNDVKADVNEEEMEELIEMEPSEAELSQYPSYIVDEDTGEILFVEEVSDTRDPIPEDSMDDPSYPDDPDYSNDPDDHNDSVEDATVVEGTTSRLGYPAEVQPEAVLGTQCLPRGEQMCVWQVEAGDGCGDLSQDGEDSSVDGDTGPLDGRVMQILPGEEAEEGEVCLAEEGAVHIIQLGQDEELELEEEMLETELGREYVLEDGVLREVKGQEEAWPVGQKQDQGEIVMFTEETEEVDGEVVGSGDTFQQEEFVLQSVEEGEYLMHGEREEQGSVPFLVLQEIQQEQEAGDQQETVQMTETNHYIQVVEKEQEQEGSHSRNLLSVNRALDVQQSCTSSRHVTASGSWTQLGGDHHEYERKFISKSVVEADSGRLSQGTVISSWTKMAGDRVRVAHSKVILARTGEDMEDSLMKLKEEDPSKKEDEIVENISEPLLYSSNGSVWRDIGSQVAPHRVSGLPTNTEEEQGETRRVEEFLEMGGILDRSCPGCGKVMSRQRNLVTHLKVIHGVSVTGKEGEEHESRYSKENVKLECDICQKLVSRKSIKRHVSLCHPGSESRYTRDKPKRL